jgi:methylated-DNA-[protein]-cysteine S-methyltransferase
VRLQLLQLDSPLGRLDLVLHEDRLCALAFPGRRDVLLRDLGRRFGPVDLDPARAGARAGAAVKAYFAGDLEAIDAVETDPGGTPFQSEVWSALRGIPAGRTLSYGDLAARLGRAGAARAVARANALNPVPIVIPCHRVIGSDGSLTGYGGGLGNKRWLLRHESTGTPFRLT